jgi:methanogenic corrinoid protein MtbC1
LKKAGYICHYFGQKVPVSEISLAFNQIKPQLLVTTFTSKLNEKGFNRIQDELIELSKEANIIISGSQLNSFNVSKKLTLIQTIPELKAIIKYITLFLNKLASNISLSFR